MVNEPINGREATSYVPLSGFLIKMAYTSPQPGDLRAQSPFSCDMYVSE